MVISVSPGKQNVSNKEKLHNACSQILQRPLEMNEVAYQDVQVQGGWQAAITLPALPGWGVKAFAGPVCQTQETAQHTAADVVLQRIMSEPQLQPLCVQPEPEWQPEPEQIKDKPMQAVHGDEGAKP